MRPCEEWTIGRNDGGRAWGPDDCVSVCCRQWSPLCFVSLSFCSLAFLLFTRSPSLTFISTNTCAFVWNCTITVGVSSYEAQVPLTFFFSAFFSCGFNGELDFIYFICSLLGSLIKISICYSLVSSLTANSNSLHPYITSWVHPAGHWDLSYTSVWVNVITSKRWSLGFKLVVGVYFRELHIVLSPTCTGFLYENNVLVVFPPKEIKAADCLSFRHRHMGLVKFRMWLDCWIEIIQGLTAK